MNRMMSSLLSNYKYSMLDWLHAFFSSCNSKDMENCIDIEWQTICHSEFILIWFYWIANSSNIKFWNVILVANMKNPIWKLSFFYYCLYFLIQFRESEINSWGLYCNSIVCLIFREILWIVWAHFLNAIKILIVILTLRGRYFHYLNLIFVCMSAFLI